MTGKDNSKNSNTTKSITEKFKKFKTEKSIGFDTLREFCFSLREDVFKKDIEWDSKTVELAADVLDKIESLAESGIQNLEEIENFLIKMKDLTKSLNEFEDKFKLLKKESYEKQLEIQSLQEKNTNITKVLNIVRDEIDAIKEEVEKLKAPPLPYGIFSGPSINGELAVISVDGRQYEVNIANENIKLEDLHSGQYLLLNGAYNIIDIRPAFPSGEVATLLDMIDDNRAIIKSRHDDETVVSIAKSLQSVKLKMGDHVRYDPNSKMIFEILPKSELEEIVLEEVPAIKYSDIGGLEKQIEDIKDSIEFPYIYKHLFSEFKLKPPKGILLYGPPGCGKTLIAKAVAHNLSLRINQTLKEIFEALELYKALSIEKIPLSEILERFEELKLSIYKREHIYIDKSENCPGDLYKNLDESGLLGNFLRKTKGKYSETQFLDLQIELADSGYTGLDPEYLGHFLEEKKKRYLIHKKEVSDEKYVTQWLEDFLLGYDVNINKIDEELKRIREKLNLGIKGYFLNIKGPELLNKYVGETEYRIREVFVKAREKAESGYPVIVFFDEMESMFRTRGSGISSDIESTIVPQFLSELDGVESIENVIVIGASNRQDLIDPAVLRPGRLDVKIKIDRPDKEAGKDIFSKYIVPNLPWHKTELEKSNNDPEAVVKRMIDFAVEEMYADKKENEFLKVTYKDGEEEILYFKDFASGAMIEAIVTRTKKYALKRMIITGDKGIKADDLLKAIRGEYKENEDLPNTTNPDDWSKISGKKGKAIASIKTIMQTRVQDKKKESEEIAVSSRYL
jgi:ATP-dependent 26S proteasome regulatory subunit